MRTLLMIAFCIGSVTSVCAETPADETPDCFSRLERETRAGDSLTVFYDDSTIVHCSRPIINFSSSILYMRSVTDSGITHSVTIPFDRISKITYRKPSGARSGLLIMGFALGAVAGLAPEEEGWPDFSRLEATATGCMLGGVIGAVGGHEIGKHITVKVTLVCR